MIEMKRTFGGASPAMVTEFETDYGFVLPSAYRQFLIEKNGGEPIHDCFVIPDWGDSIVNFFYGLKAPGHDLAVEYERYEGDIPGRLVPIADDPGGNQLCLSVRGETAGRVYFWFHEDHTVVIELARTFEEFVQSLTSDLT